MRRQVFLLLLLSPLWFMNVQAAETTEEQRQFLHFGNMGGLMPNLSPTSLPEPDSRAAKYLARYCTQCHNMPGPGMRTQEEWSRIYWNMYWRMHLMNTQFKTFEVLEYGEGEELFRYLMRNALKPVKYSAVAWEQDGAADYGRTCMQCHQLPDPKQHTVDEWPTVVSRMKGHMKSMGKLVPNDQQQQQILRYLGKMSGK